MSCKMSLNAIQFLSWLELLIYLLPLTNNLTQFDLQLLSVSPNLPRPIGMPHIIKTMDTNSTIKVPKGRSFGQ